MRQTGRPREELPSRTRPGQAAQQTRCTCKMRSTECSRPRGIPGAWPDPGAADQPPTAARGGHTVRCLPDLTIGDGLRTKRVTVAGGACTVAASLSVVLFVQSPAVPSPLAGTTPSPLIEGIAVAPCAPKEIAAVPPRVRGSYDGPSSLLQVGGSFYRGTSRPAPVTTAESACARRARAASSRWLAAGAIPAAGTPLAPMAVRALLDLHLLERPDGAVAAGWYPGWDYCWPRDASWVAVALADTGHPADALRILQFLARVQSAGGTWAARYLLNGSAPVRDGRPAELDAVGWVPWAVWSWYAARRLGRTGSAGGLVADGGGGRRRGGPVADTRRPAPTVHGLLGGLRSGDAGHRRPAAGRLAGRRRHRRHPRS
jgi:hypothetical protein